MESSPSAIRANLWTDLTSSPPADSHSFKHYFRKVQYFWLALNSTSGGGTTTDQYNQKRWCQELQGSQRGIFWSRCSPGSFSPECCLQQPSQCPRPSSSSQQTSLCDIGGINGNTKILCSIMIKKSIWYKNTMSLTHWCCGRHIQMLWDVTWRPPHSQWDRKGLRSETWPQRWQNQGNRASTLEPSKQENFMKVFIFLLWCFDDDGMLDNSMVWWVLYDGDMVMHVTMMVTLGRRVTRTPRRRELGQGRFSRPFSAKPTCTMIGAVNDD